jgi:uncharacterized membrane protein
MTDSGSNLFGIVGPILLLLVILELVRRKYLREKYSLIWIATGTIFLLLAMRADLLNKISYWLGFSIPSNALFFFGILFLLFIVLGLSVITSRLAEKNRILTQEVVLLKKRVSDLEDSPSTRGDKTPERI